MVVIGGGWGGVRKGMDLTIQKLRTDMEAKGMALIGTMIVEPLQ